MSWLQTQKRDLTKYHGTGQSLFKKQVEIFQIGLVNSILILKLDMWCSAVVLWNQIDKFMNGKYPTKAEVKKLYFLVTIKVI